VGEPLKPSVRSLRETTYEESLDNNSSRLGGCYSYFDRERWFPSATAISIPA
jgi:hypothetical protein